MSILFNRSVKWIPFDLRWQLHRFATNTLPAFLARLRRSFKIKQLTSFPAGQNPFWHDSYHTGVPLGRNVVAMNTLGGHSQHLDYVILVDLNTGQRIKISFAPEPTPSPVREHALNQPIWPMR